VDVVELHQRENLMQRNGIAAGGTFVVDHTKLIDAFPEPEALVHILDHRVGNGGGAFNLLVDLARRGSARVPTERIRGTAGAGDAFAAGFLLGWHEQTSLDEALLNGIAAATACLLEPTTSDGVRPLAEYLELVSTLGLRPAP
jgi:sugar/nucleoside kinase (ribokinase family)